jgi:hypothetical protein
MDFRVGVIPQVVQKQRKFPVMQFSLPFSSSVFDFQQEPLITNLIKLISLNWKGDKAVTPLQRTPAKQSLLTSNV